MYILIIPDVHLKPDLFRRADGILRSGQAEMAVCLGDLVDDYPIDDAHSRDIQQLFYDTFDAFEEFATQHDMLYCWGDHDLAYFWNKHQTNKIPEMDCVVRYRFDRVIKKKQNGTFAHLHQLGNVLFSHAGLSVGFVNDVLRMKNRSLHDIIDRVNRSKPDVLWNNQSPLLLRPQWNGDDMYNPSGKLVQVFGHTPTPDIWQYKNCLSADVFSKAPFQISKSCNKFVIIDSVTGEFDYAIG